jgi:hypothetical protein
MDMQKLYELIILVIEEGCKKKWRYLMTFRRSRFTIICVNESREIF